MNALTELIKASEAKLSTLSGIPVHSDVVVLSSGRVLFAHSTATKDAPTSITSSSSDRATPTPDEKLARSIMYERSIPVSFHNGLLDLFMAVILTLLIDEGSVLLAGNIKLALTTKINDILPSAIFSDAYLTQHCTMMDLLAHRSGLPGSWALEIVQKEGGDRLSMLRRIPVNMQFFRVRASPSPLGSYLVALALDSLIGPEELNKFIKIRIIEHCGLEGTEIDFSRKDTQGQTTAGDLANLSAFLADPSKGLLRSSAQIWQMIAPREIQNQMDDSASLLYQGLGWSIYPIKDKSFVGVVNMGPIAFLHLPREDVFIYAYENNALQNSLAYFSVNNSGLMAYNIVREALHFLVDAIEPKLSSLEAIQINIIPKLRVGLNLSSNLHPLHLLAGTYSGPDGYSEIRIQLTAEGKPEVLGKFLSGILQHHVNEIYLLREAETTSCVPIWFTSALTGDVDSFVVRIDHQGAGYSHELQYRKFQYVTATNNTSDIPRLPEKHIQSKLAIGRDGSFGRLVSEGVLSATSKSGDSFKSDAESISGISMAESGTMSSTRNLVSQITISTSMSVPPVAVIPPSPLSEKSELSLTVDKSNITESSVDLKSLSAELKSRDSINHSKDPGMVETPQENIAPEAPKSNLVSGPIKLPSRDPSIGHRRAASSARYAEIPLPVIPGAIAAPSSLIPPQQAPLKIAVDFLNASPLIKSAGISSTTVPVAPPKDPALGHRRGQSSTSAIQALLPVTPSDTNQVDLVASALNYANQSFKRGKLEQGRLSMREAALQVISGMPTAPPKDPALGHRRTASAAHKNEETPLPVPPEQVSPTSEAIRLSTHRRSLSVAQKNAETPLPAVPADVMPPTLVDLPPKFEVTMRQGSLLDVSHKEDDSPATSAVVLESAKNLDEIDKLFEDMGLQVAEDQNSTESER